VSTVATFTFGGVRCNATIGRQSEAAENEGRTVIIKNVDLEPVTLRKEDPDWRFALGASPISEGVIIRLVTDDGHAGEGYAASAAHRGAILGTLKAELELFGPILVGKDPTRIESILGALDRAMRGASQAKAGIDCALYDLQARALGVPLCQLLGGQVRGSVPILRILAIKTPDEMAVQAQKLIDKGYRYLKIKVHGDVDEDVARVAAIRRQVGEVVHLTIDANQSYTPKSAVSAINRMAQYNIDLVEQPVPVADRRGLKLVTDLVPVTIEADEAAGSLSEIYELVTGEMVDAVSLKVPKLGGLRKTLAAARICEAAGVRYRLGATVGSRLLAAQALHLACALPGVDYACELGEFDRLLDDPFEGLEVDEGVLKLPPGPGSGVRRRKRN
jgi:L-alanine-DL-glutamate epimerase-like enolase superfamily enzyme